MWGTMVVLGARIFGVGRKGARALAPAACVRVGVARPPGPVAKEAWVIVSMLSGRLAIGQPGPILHDSRWSTNGYCCRGDVPNDCGASSDDRMAADRH